MEPNIDRLRGKKRSVLGLALLALIVVCTIPLVMQLWGMWQGRQAELDDGRTTTSNVARALAADAESSIKLAAAVLDDVVERVEHDGTGHAAASRLHAMLRNRVTRVSVLQNVFVYGADGEWLINSLIDPLHLNNADREYFKFHQAHPDRKLHVGAPVLSRATGVWVLPLSRRIDHADGTFAGVAAATIEIAHFDDFYRKFNIGEAGAVMLATDQGVILTRRPYDAALIGASIAHSPVFGLLGAERKEGSAMLVARIDGVERLYSFRRVQGLPLVVIVGMAKQELLAAWWANTLRTGAALGVLIAAMVFLGRYVAIQIRIREALEDRLLASTALLERQNATLTVMAARDGLTGLANRRHFDQTLEREFARAFRNDTSIALLMIDVDHFKKFNDHYGHLAGDDCLRQVAGAVRTGQRRGSDLTARYGGEEFVVVLPDTDMAGALAVAEKIRAAVWALRMPHEAAPGKLLSVSIGLHAMQPAQTGERPEDLILIADRLLYDAKAAGRNTVRSFAMPRPAASNGAGQATVS